MKDMCACLYETVEAFFDKEKVTYCERYGNGHIGDTFLVIVEEGEQKKRYILQRKNHEIFKETLALIENIDGVTSFLRKKIIERGGNPDRETLTLVLTHDGKNHYVDAIGCYWVVYIFIEDSVCLEQVETPEDFYESAVAFGNFQSLLADYPAETLHETIPNFHNTPVRFETFLKAVEEDVCGRAASVQPEIQFVMNHKEDMGVAMNLLAKGKLPLRVTHNDTKLNNIMLDKDTKKGVCVIDLDTVMPGLSIFDFGDSIRFGANTAVEDELDLSKVSLSLELFEQYTKGFLDGCKGSLTALEKKMLPMGAKIMTLECGMRFLTDYLQGDTYFKIKREKHNLDRCRTQFALVADMEKKWDKMEQIVAEN